MEVEGASSDAPIRRRPYARLGMEFHHHHIPGFVVALDVAPMKGIRVKEKPSATAPKHRYDALTKGPLHKGVRKPRKVITLNAKPSEPMRAAGDPSGMGVGVHVIQVHEHFQSTPTPVVVPLTAAIDLCGHVAPEV